MVFVGVFLWAPKNILVGGWTNPSEKYARQIGSFPQVGVKKKIETTTQYLSECHAVWLI